MTGYCPKCFKYKCDCYEFTVRAIRTRQEAIEYCKKNQFKSVVMIKDAIGQECKVEFWYDQCSRKVINLFEQELMDYYEDDKAEFIFN